MPCTQHTHLYAGQTFYASVIDLHGLLGVGALDVLLDMVSFANPFRGHRVLTPVRIAVVPAMVEQGNKVSERTCLGPNTYYACETKHVERGAVQGLLIQRPGVAGRRMQ